MRKPVRNYILAVIMALLALFQAVSGFVLWLVLPSGQGYQGGRGSIVPEVFIWDRHTWIDLHDWVAVTLLVMLVVHLILHRRWIVYMTKNLFKQRG